jgi:AhpC/TSA family
VSARGPLDFEPDEEDLRGAPASPPPRPPWRPDPRATAPRYVWVVGVAALVLVAVLVVSTLTRGTERGARGVPDGAVVPPFAVPLALSDLDGDANLAREAGQGQAGDRPACSVRGPRVLNGCALREQGPFVLAFFTTRGKQCVAQLDTMERVRPKLGGVRFAAVAIRGDRDQVRALVRRHRWGFPVGYDRDGALANAYHVQVCPQLTFARRGGRVAETTFGALDDAALTAKARGLQEAAG